MLPELYISLLSGFTNSALMVLLLVFAVPCFIVWAILMLVFKRNIKSNRRNGRSNLMLLTLLFIGSVLFVAGVIVLQYWLTGKGLLE